MTTCSPGRYSGYNYLILYDPSTGSQLTSAYAYGYFCASITYTFYSSCRTYELREGCYSSYSCSGTVYYSGSSVDAPTASPSISLAPGTPTYAPTSSGYCPAYSATNTNYAYQNYATCSITACYGDTVYMTTCSPGSYSGYNYLTLYDPSTGSQLTSASAYGYSCVSIFYTFYSSCRTYELREGCIYVVIITRRVYMAY
jgi:hypothetical protein